MKNKANGERNCHDGAKSSSSMLSLILENQIEILKLNRLNLIEFSVAILIRFEMSGSHLGDTLK